MSERLRALKQELERRAQVTQGDAQQLWSDTSAYLDRTINQLDEAAKRWATASDEARLQLHLGLAEGKEKAALIQNEVDALWKDAEATGERVERTIDLAKLRAHLARMDAEDRLKEKREQLTRLVRESREQAVTQVVSGLREISGRVEALLTKLR